MQIDHPDLRGGYTVSGQPGCHSVRCTRNYGLLFAWFDICDAGFWLGEQIDALRPS